MIKKTIVGLLALVLLLVPAACKKSIDIPEDPLLITADASYLMGGESRVLYIYEDGSIIYIEEKGLRMSTWKHPPTRTWKTGKLSEEELNSLLEFIKNSGFEKLDEYYQFPGEEIEGGGFRMGDMDYTVSINYGDLHNTAGASGYLTPDGGMTYPDMPYPLNEIYQKLRQIAENKTEEVYREKIS
jgi:hypothetical protein